MLESAWLWLGTAAFVWTVVALVSAAVADVDGPGESIATVSGVVGLVLWGVWSFGAFEITVVSQGTEITFAHPELALVGICMAIVPGYIALTGPVELIGRARDPDLEDL